MTLSMEKTVLFLWWLEDLVRLLLDTNNPMISEKLQVRDKFLLEIECQWKWLFLLTNPP